MTTKYELHKNEAVEKPSKIARVKKFTKLLGESSVVFPRVVRIYVTDKDATDSSSDDEENLQGEKSKQHKRICKEVIFKNRKTKVISKWMSSKEKKDTKVLQGNKKKYKGVRLRKWGRWAAEIQDGRSKIRRWLGTFDTAKEAALEYDKASIEINGANAFTNILEPPPNNNPIKTMPPPRKTKGKSIF